ncbi:MAG: ATP-dependent zinc metalloprotease FtsH [Bacteroidales bacterium]|nr:ATP-dependent zinc metalloprotease FtsH [Bacteroidales bacterium]
MKKIKFSPYWLYAAFILFMVYLLFMRNDVKVPELTWKKLEQAIRNKHVEKIVVVNKEFAEIFIKPEALRQKEFEDAAGRESSSYKGPHYTYKFLTPEAFENQVNAVIEDQFRQDTIGKTPAEKDLLASQKGIVLVPEERVNWVRDFFLYWVLPILIFIIIWIVLFRGIARSQGGGGPGNIFNFGKSRPTLLEKGMHVNVTFEDVAGMDEVKMEVQEIVDFLKNPQKYARLGGKVPKGVLLAGPPGTGKTLLARAVAGEAQVPFFSISGSDFVEMFVGVGASRVRDLFKQAKEKAPCIVFIDEIDAVGRARGKFNISGANDERESTLNQLLAEMDGFSTNSGIIVMGATNRVDILDKALLRPGRFDRIIYVDLPELKEREEIFKVHMRPLKLSPDVSAEFLAKQTPGFSGADIANVCNEAALIAARKNKDAIDVQDFQDAIDRVVAGLEKKNKIVTENEKRMVAFHETGHAVVSWFTPHGHPLIKVTIVPRGKSLGASWYQPEERQLATREQIFDELVSLLGGRAAEEVFIGTVSTGALNDLERATKQAYASVAYFGLSDKLKNLSYYDSTNSQEYLFSKPYSEKTAQIIDEEVSKLIASAYDRAKQILIEHADQVRKLGNMLYEKQILYREDLEQILGPRPFIDQKISTEQL